MFKTFSRRLASRLGLSVILIESLSMIAIGFVYYSNFANQIDERQREQLRIASNLITHNNINLTALVDHEVMSSLVGDEIENAMLIDSEGVIVAYSLKPEYRRMQAAEIPFLNSLDFDAKTITYLRFEDNGTPYQASMQPFITSSTSNRQFVLYLSKKISEAEAEKSQTAFQLLLGFGLTVVMTSAMIFWFFRAVILGRLAELVQVFYEVEKGNLSVRSQLRSRWAVSEDEIGILQRGTNAMITRLETLVNDLEQRVADRTRDLTISAKVSRQAATILNQAELLTQLVDLTRNAFGFYQVSIFQYLPSEQKLCLVAASGEAGRAMLADEKNFSISDKGLVPSAARKREVIMSSVVTQNPDHAFNPYLPETQSEAALPIVFGADLIGVLDLQSQQSNRFIESDIELFSAFADQLAVLFRNAALFESVESARQKAELADKAKSAFLASTSHELRTPLNAIINLSSYVKNGLIGPVEPRQVELLSLVIQSGQSLLALINDVLDMSKIESGSLKLYLESGINLKPIIDTTCTTAESLLQGKPVKLVSKIPDNLPTVTVDKHRIQQILLNILSNACKFTDEGEIELQVSLVDNTIKVAIRDTGCGIATEDIGQVFEKFTQTESGLRQGGGTGLGMPITKSLIEAHGGEIWLESQVGIGTTFHFTLPVSNSTINAKSSQKEDKL